MLRKVAGLDTYYIDGQGKTGDIALNFITTIFDKNPRFPAIKNAFWALMIFAVLLLILVTIVTVIRQEYSPAKDDKGKNDKSNIIKKSFKSLFMFLIVPVSCIFGLMLGDIILGTLDKITAGGDTNTAILEVKDISSKIEGTVNAKGELTYTYYDIFGYGEPATTTTFSSMMFKTASYSANRARNDKNFANKVISGQLTNFGIFNYAETGEDCAQLIDDAFAYNIKLVDNNSNVIILGDMEGLAGEGPFFTLKEGQKIENLSKFNVSLVWYFYDLWQFNFLIGFAFVIIGTKLLCSIVLGLMKRIIELVTLFVVSPPIIATMPLDSGKSFGNWKKSFLSKALGVFGAVIGMNLIFLVLPYVQNIDFFGDDRLFLINYIIQLIFVLVGISVVDGFIEMISKLFGDDNVLKGGQDVMGKVGDNVAGAATFVGGAAGTVLALTGTKAAFKLGAKAVAKTGVIDGAKNAFKGAGNAASNAFVWGNKRKELMQKAEGDWNENADKMYNNKMLKDETYANQIDGSYNDYLSSGGKLTKDEWLSNDASSVVRQNAENEYSSRTGQTRDDFKANSVEREEYIKNQYKDSVHKTGSERAKKIASATLETTGVKNAISLGGQYTSHVKDGMITGGKGGINAMIMAFKGFTKSKMDEEKLYKKMKKEETPKLEARYKEKNKKK